MAIDKMYQAILENMSELVYVRDLDKNLLYINPASEKLTGWSLNEAIGKKCFDVFGDEGMTCRDVCPIEKAILERLHVLHHEGKLKTRFGDKREMQVSISPLYEAESVTGAVVVMEDITRLREVEQTNLKTLIALENETEKSKRSERDLEQANNVLNQERNMFLDGPVVVFKWRNEDGWPVDYVSSNVKDVLGYSVEDFTSGKTSYVEIIYEKDMEQVSNEVTRFSKSSTERFEHEPYQLSKKDGEVIWVRDFTTILRDASGEITHYLGYLIDITTQCVSEEALRERESSLRQIIDLVPHFIFVKDETGKFEIVNKATAEVYGTTVEDLIGRREAEFVANDEDVERFRLDDLEVIRSGETKFIQEEPITDSENNIRYLQTTKVPYKISGSGKRALLGVAVDITNIKLVEEALRESNKRLTTVMDSIDALVYIVDMQTHEVLFINEYGQRIFGDAKGQLCWKAFQKEQLGPCAFCTSDRLLTKEGSSVGTYQWEHQNTVNGRWYDCRGKAIPWLDGRLVRMEIATDITNRKRAEESLRIERDNLVNVFESIEDGIYIVNQQFDVQYINSVLVNEFGAYDGRKCYEYFHDRDEVCPWCKNQDVLAGKTVRWEWHSIKNGKTYDLIDTPMTLQDGSIGKLEMFHDITKRKQAEEQIKQNLKEKEVLLSEIHHRVKNNMQVISSLLKLQSAKIEDKKYVEMFKDSENRIRSMSLIHEKLYQSGDFANVNFDGYVKNIANDLIRSYAVTPDKIKLNTKIEDVSLGLDNAIPCGLIINELISNSLKYAFPKDREGEIKIVLREINSNEIELTVSDDGIGIPAEIDIRETESLGLQLVYAFAIKNVRKIYVF